MQRYEQESRSEHAGDFDGGREGSKHLTLVSLYRFIGLCAPRLPRPYRVLRFAYPLLLVSGGWLMSLWLSGTQLWALYYRVFG